jgi:hypothetical protein
VHLPNCAHERRRLFDRQQVARHVLGHCGHRWSVGGSPQSS